MKNIFETTLLSAALCFTPALTAQDVATDSVNGKQHSKFQHAVESL